MRLNHVTTCSCRLLLLFISGYGAFSFVFKFSFTGWCFVGPMPQLPGGRISQLRPWGERVWRGGATVSELTLNFE
jgi:hypothetical protein